ncbi:IS66 family transposase [Catenovulum sediminis]|uniref:IS66 family transposase n=1 Tax=Catenovulum sediminis TaxID=1740262 RepID=UPI00117BF93F|nr:IS66 family transposase [Catenovulum sediminis]
MKMSPKAQSNQASTSVETTTEMAALLSEKDDIIDKKSEVIAWQQQRIALLEEYLNLANQKRFGSSSEQTTAEQGNLFNEAEITAEPEQEELLLPDTASKTKTGRKPFSDKLPREQVFAYLSEKDKAGAIDTFFVKVREELDIIPAQVRVLEYMQEKAVFKDEQDKRIIKAAEVTLHPVAKAMGSVNLMTYVIVSKYADGMPLYRLENIIRRYGGDISRATLANWVIALARQVQPLIHLLREYQHNGPLIMADETRIQVLKEPGASPTGDKYMWVTLGGEPNRQSVLFEYDPSRSQEVPLRLLDGFTGGYLQSDGYAGYNAVCKEYKLTSLGCWDHARRKFKEAQIVQPKSKKTKVSKADMALSYINKLYVIERNIKSLSADGKYQARQAQSVPVLNKLKKWLDVQRPKVVKDSLTGTAMTYLHNQWDKLTVYCKDGRLNISNILAENAIRPFAVGRKAWLFADSPAGAHASGIHYSLIETAKLNGLEPYHYLNAVFKALPYADTVEKLERLLPWNFKAENKES